MRPFADATVFTAGDNVYPNGHPNDWRNCYDPWWGEFKSRTRPGIGNHDYETQNGKPYFDYWGDRAGPRDAGYYTYVLGTWRIFAINSEIDTRPGSPQYHVAAERAGHRHASRAWRRSGTSRCTPPASTGRNAHMRDIYRLLYNANAEIVINGHDHNYEVFHPQDADGRGIDARGIRQFVVGTGGVALTNFPRVAPNSDYREQVQGVIKFDLDAELVQLAVPLAATAANAATRVWSVSLIGEAASHRPAARCGAAPAAAQTQKPGAKPPPPKVRVRWTNHPRIDIGDLRIDFRARVTADVRKSEASFDEDELDRTVDLARRRFGVEGQFRNLVDFQIERELGSGPVRSLARRLRQLPSVRVRQFPLRQVQAAVQPRREHQLDRTSTSRYRSLIATHLAPGRDIGWMAHGRVLDRHIGYEFGVFEQDGDNARTRNLERVVGRHDGRLARLGAAAAQHRVAVHGSPRRASPRTSSDVPEGFPALQGDAVLGARMFEADFWVLGERKRTGIEFRWRPGPVSVKFESIRLTNERLGQGVEEDDLSPYEAKGWYLSGTWAITGETKADGLEDPKKPLFQGGPGAIEVAARVERITFGTTAVGGDVSTSPRADRYQGNSNKVTTLGVNWYLNHWVKVQFNYIKESLTDPAQGPLPEQPSYTSRVFRFQFQF